MKTLDVARASEALLSSGSRFLSHAADWLAHHDDPVALLLVLTKETGPALGPWATFRWCALLGLTQVSAVVTLGKDVLDEEPEHPLHAVDAAFAKAHASRAIGDHAASHVDTVREMLARTDHDDVVAARLALACAGLAPMESTFASKVDAALSSEVALEHAARAAGPLLEALLLAAPLARQREGIARAVTTLAARQDESGLVVVSGRARVDRFETLRALALTTRMAREV